ncbi:MAG: tRNA threonylcarbamoyladenosine dehydratase [Lachnospiraceae bacterium]|nr:tRNA threonylcarbamoyladenosine dehydratase [Lachnospiraceae bacterium]
MEQDRYSRTRLLLGDEALEKLSKSHVAVFGIGGVGGYVCEALVRSGVGAFDLVDSDTVAPSNLNRQIIALNSTIGLYKVDVMRERMLDIAPETVINARRCFFLPENSGSFPFESYDYVVDAVDTVTAKTELILKAKSAGVPVISSMGAGNKLDPGGFKVADIYDTKVCPLARVMRRELKSRGIESLKVVYSEEKPLRQSDKDTAERKVPPGSTAWVPASAGLMIATEVIKDLIGLR